MNNARSYGVAMDQKKTPKLCRMHYAMPKSLTSRFDIKPGRTHAQLSDSRVRDLIAALQMLGPVGYSAFELRNTLSPSRHILRDGSQQFL